MSLASGTDTLTELRTLAKEVGKLSDMLQPYRQGDATATRPGRFTEAQIDAQITLVSNAITAVNA